MRRGLRMLLRGLAVVAAWAGCYGPTYVDCAITCPSNSCPNGLSCVDGFCRAASADLGNRCVDAPPGDRDGDTFTDDVDNCPETPNPDQADEDGDKIGDACDPCPAFPGVDNNDDDQDGVGNGCDPNPTMKGDKILLFVGFNGTQLPPGAMATGNWLIMGGQARLSDSLPGGAPADLLWELATTGNESVLAKVRLSNLAAPSASGGVIAQIAGGNGVACQVGFDASSATKIMLHDPNGAILGSSAASNITQGTFLLDERRTDMEYRCSAPVAPTRASATVTAPPATTASFGLRAKDVAVTYDWLMVVGH